MGADDRIVTATRLYEQGATLATISGELGVSRERVRQILKASDVQPRPPGERLYAFTFPRRAREVETLFLRLRDDEAVAQRTGIPATHVRRFVDETIPDPDVLRRRRSQGSERYSDEEFVECLRIAAGELGAPFSHARYAEWSRGRALDDDRPWPGPQGMMLRFGSWRNTLTRAGLPANHTAGPDPTFDLNDGINAVVRAWRETGSPPTVASFDEWRARRPEFPSSPTVRKFVGGWADIQLAAWPVVHARTLPGVGSEELPRGESPDEASLGGGDYRTANEQTDVAPTDPFERDPQELERSLASHNTLQNQLAELAREHGCKPLSPLVLDPRFDLGWRRADGVFVVVEVKSATPSNLEGQMRIGLGQLLRYGAALEGNGETVEHVLAVELEPDEQWLQLLARLDVRLVTPADLSSIFD